MRSIIKSRRKSDSSFHELSPPADLTMRKPQSRLNKVPSSSKLNSPPTAHSNPNSMTPPKNVISDQPISVSSPKKLLTPIKKMFGHHSKQTNLSSASDALDNVLNGDFEPPKGRKEYPGDYSPATNLAELRDTLGEKPFGRTNSSSPVSSSSPDTRQSSKPVLQYATPRKASVKLHLDVEDPTATNSNDIPILAGREVATPVAIQYFSSDSSPVEDEEQSDCSSNFSFEKGVRGGRNTSVKYYKTKSETAPNSASAEGYFNMDDMGFEDGAISDYDFENNGMSDDDEAYGENFDEDNPESSNRYNDFLSEEALPATLDFEGESFDDANSEVDAIYQQDTISINVDSTADSIHPNSETNHLSAERLPGSATINTDASAYFESGAKSPGYDDDFIDSYLDREKSSGSDIATSLNEPLASSKNPSHDSELNSSSHHSRGFDNDMSMAVSSPESDGESEMAEPSVGLGINFGVVQEEQNTKGKANNRLSILKMMETLLRIDGETEGLSPRVPIQGLGPVSMESESNNVIGAEVVESNPETEHASPGLSSTKKHEDPARKRQIRKSLIDMMNTLSRLDNDLQKEPEESAIKLTKKDVRKSIADMMSTLQSLESHPEVIKEDEQPSQEGEKPKIVGLNQSADSKSRKRYSWYSNDGSSDCNSSLGFDRSSEGHALQLSQDILDEINQLPEDYDFTESLVTDSDDTRAFLRSNSYKNRPQKVVHDFNVQNNKLQLSNRTVTFYKTNSSDHAEYNRASKSKIGSKIGSIRSTPSLHSIDDEEFHESDDDSKYQKQETPLPIKSRASLTSVSLSKDFGLHSISEAHSHLG